MVDCGVTHGYGVRTTPGPDGRSSPDAVAAVDFARGGVRDCPDEVEVGERVSRERLLARDRRLRSSSSDDYRADGHKELVHHTQVKHLGVYQTNSATDQRRVSRAELALISPVGVIQCMALARIAFRGKN